MLVGVTLLITIIGFKDMLANTIDLRLVPQFLVALGILLYKNKN